MQRIEDAVEAVLEFLKEIPMSASSVNYHRTCYKVIKTYCQASGINTFTESDAKAFSKIQMTRYENGEIGITYALMFRKAAAMLADHMSGKILVWKRRNYNQKRLCDCYEQAIIDFEAFLSRRLAPGSVRMSVQNVRHVLYYLERNDIRDLKKMKLEDLKKYVVDVAPRCPNSIGNIIWPIKRFAAFLSSAGYTVIDAEQLSVVSAPRRVKVLPCFSDEEVVALLSAVDTTTSLGKRDYAIMKVAIGTGLRGEDIFGLRLADIDWQKNEISVIQRKTGGHIVLPLMPDVGNAIADYILNARPQADSPYVFLRHNKPHVWLGDGPTGALIIKRYQERAGISREAGDGKTFHAFRRTVGTRLIKAEVSLESAAQILGHKRIDSAKRYIVMNDEMLRVCCMDISSFATKKEGLI